MHSNNDFDHTSKMSTTKLIYLVRKKKCFSNVTELVMKIVMLLLDLNKLIDCGLQIFW